MKVLITNGSNPITWYHGMEGKMFTVSYIKDFHYFLADEEVPYGETFGPFGVHFPDGELLYTFEEYTELEQANLMHKDDVTALTIRNVALNNEVSLHEQSRTRQSTTIREKNNEINKLRGMLVTADEEKAELLKTIVRAVDEHKPVVLPKEVAQELQNWYNQGYSNFEIIALIRSNHCTNNPLHLELSPMSRWADRHQNPFMRALADGYTVAVEQTTEDKITSLYASYVDKTNFDGAYALKQMAEFQGNSELVDRLNSIDEAKGLT